MGLLIRFWNSCSIRLGFARTVGRSPQVNIECELLGYVKQNVLGRPVWELVAPEQQEESKRNVLRKLAGEQPLAPFFREYVGRDGKRLLLHIHENLIRSGRALRYTLIQFLVQMPQFGLNPVLLGDIEKGGSNAANLA